MHYIVQFQDATGQEGLRQQHMAAHLAFLQENASQIQAAGPLFDPGGTGQGGLWLVMADTAQTVTELVRADPFFDTGLRKSFAILEWRQVFRDGARVR